MLATSLPVAQWLEHPTSVRKVIGSIPVGTQIFSLFHAREMLNIPSFPISSLSLTFTIFLYLSPIGHFDIADPSSMQGTSPRTQ